MNATHATSRATDHAHAHGQGDVSGHGAVWRLAHGVRGRRRTMRAGLGLAEMLISLSIAASLLTAVAVATAASARIVTETESFSRASQAARVTMNLILADCRRGQPEPYSCTATQVRVLTAENVDRTYVYLPDARQIVVVNNDVPGDPGRVIARNVAAAVFHADADGTPLATRRVTLDLTVQVGKNAVHLTGSAAPRQNASY